MSTNDLVILRRKALVGCIALSALILAAIILISANGREYELELAGALIMYFGWILLPYWVALDSLHRKARRLPWILLTVLTGPLGLLLYVISRPPAPARCLGCGAKLSSVMEACFACGKQSLIGRVVWTAGSLYGRFLDYLANSPREATRDTVKHMAIALGVFCVFGLIASELLPQPLQTVVHILWVLSTAGYWVLTAWWVYLDATWRRMDAMPWAVLTLVTNLFGLVTYLVIRYPDPRSCPQCSAYLKTGLKICPYCGAQTEPACPKCQSPVQRDWIYCPSCASQLPAVREQQTAADSGTVSLTISGTVTDAASGAPIPYTRVAIDSKTGNRDTMTDAAGCFMLSGLEPKPYVLLAQAEGYNRDVRACTPNASGHLQVHFALHRDREGGMVNG